MATSSRPLAINTLCYASPALFLLLLAVPRTASYPPPFPFLSHPSTPPPSDSCPLLILLSLAFSSCLLSFVFIYQYFIFPSNIWIAGQQQTSTSIGQTQALTLPSPWNRWAVQLNLNRSIQHNTTTNTSHPTVGYLISLDSWIDWTDFTPSMAS